MVIRFISKGLEFPVVALVAAGPMPAAGEDEREELRLFYVLATRATQLLVVGGSGGGGSPLWYRKKTRLAADN